MHNPLALCIIGCLILILLAYLNFNFLKDSYQSKNNNNKNEGNNAGNNEGEGNNAGNNEGEEEGEEDEEMPVTLADIFVAKNKLDYKKYINEKNKVIGNSKFKFGYSVLPGTNPNTIGFCPLGSYYLGKFVNNTQDVFKKCKKCFDCGKKQGYFVEGGCLGDKDVECKFGKVPHQIFINSHHSKNPLHSQLPKHHTHQIVNSPHFSNLEHNHI
jgi:hypothetical protein